MTAQVQVIAIATACRPQLQAALEQAGIHVTADLAETDEVCPHLQRDGLDVPLQVLEYEPGATFVVIPVSPLSLRFWRWPTEWRLVDDVIGVVAEFEIPYAVKEDNFP